MGPTEDEARHLFIAYEGSTFYMSRDGVEERYRDLHVPRDVEERWLAELTAGWIDRLAESGNWKSVHRLMHHADFTHVSTVVDSEPKGRLWERTAYLEEMLGYVGAAFSKSRATRDEVVGAAEKALASSDALRRAGRSTASRARVDALVRHAESMRSSTG